MAVEVSPEIAARLVGALATLNESVIPELQEAGVFSRDPRTLNQLERAVDSLQKALDRIFMVKPGLMVDVQQVVNRRVLCLDIGQVGTMMAFQYALDAFDEGRPPKGGTYARTKFESGLMDKLGIKKAQEEGEQSK